MSLASSAARDPGRWSAIVGVTVYRLFGVFASAAVLTLAACGSSDGAGSAVGDSATVSVVVDSANTSATVGTESTASTFTDASTPDTGVEGVQPSGFTTVRATITDPTGEECEVCLWLADSPEERGLGLMGVTDLGDAVGMAFLFEEPTNGAFYMFQTPTPLSIAWFDIEGSWVGSADMEPCTDKPANECALYSPGASYDLAIEVFDGGLDELGLTEGSTVVLLDGTEALDCQTPDS